MMKLVIQDDEGKTTVVPLIRDEITVGRKEGNTIRLTERNVSRKHARIVKNNGSISVEDLNSYNGVRVNGSRIQGRVGLNVSDRIQIGDYLIELKAEGAAAVPTDAFGDETQPVETMAAAAAAAAAARNVAAVSIPQSAPGDDDATTKMATPMTAMMPAAQLDGAAEAVAPPAPQPEATPPARLVILSTNLAGQEYDLTQLAMVIGRTEDNDVVINHRSISRHHAKVVNENGRHAIVDMQSSNGVRVNGEEYSKVELRRGDVIDLGHVRMRFVEPGEDFVFGRDAHAVSVPGSGNRSIMFIAIAVLLLGGLAIFLLTRGGDEKGAEKPVAATSPDETADNGTADEVGAEPTPSTSEDLERIKPLLDLARTNIEKENWSAAQEAAKKALETAPENGDAKELLERAEFELDNKSRYGKFQKAAKNVLSDPQAVADTFGEISDDSVYKEKARTEYDQARDKYVVQVTDEANKLAKRRKCDDLDTLKESAGQPWEEAEAAIADIDCAAAVAAKKKTREDKKTREREDKKEPEDDKPDDPPEDKQPPTVSYDDAMAAAKSAMMKNQYGKARRSCDDALKAKPRDAAAATMCGIAACNMKKARLAKKYQGLVSTDRKAMIRQSCLKAGLTDF